MIQQFLRLLCRFRHPVSLPEDVAQALGIHLSNFLSCEDCLSRITSPTCFPARLRKLMPRNLAEEAFSTARRMDRFKQCSLFSYYFDEGWLEFELRFDADARLRRVYVRHRRLPQDEGVELSLLAPSAL